MRYLIALLATSLLVTACQTTATRSRTYESHEEMIAGIIKITTTVCVSKMNSEPEGREMLDALNLSASDVCQCAYEKIFGTMDEQELDRFIEDSMKYGGQIAEHEPWKKRVLSATIACTSQVTADLAPSLR